MKVLGFIKSMFIDDAATADKPKAVNAALNLKYNIGSSQHDYTVHLPYRDYDNIPKPNEPIELDVQMSNKFELIPQLSDKSILESEGWVDGKLSQPYTDNVKDWEHIFGENAGNPFLAPPAKGNFFDWVMAGMPPPRKTVDRKTKLNSHVDNQSKDW